MVRQPSLRAIIWVDQIALMAALFPVVSVVLGGLAAAGVLPDVHASRRAGALTYVSSASSPFFYWLALATFAAGVAIIGWRVGKVRSAFALGSVVDGRITSLRAFKDRAYLKYTYEVRSKSITATHFVHQTKAVKALVEGGAVRVAVNPRSPKDGFVVELFG